MSPPGFRCNSSSTKRAPATIRSSDIRGWFETRRFLTLVSNPDGRRALRKSGPRDSHHLFASLARFSRPLLLQQSTLALDPPTVTRKIAVAANNAMAGNHYGCRICGAGAGYGTNRTRTANRASNFTIGAGCPVWDPPQLLPNTPLKSGRLHVRWQIQV